MKNSTLNLRLIAFSSVLLLNQFVFAQDDNEKRQKALKETNEQLQGVYERNLPNKKSSSVRNYSDEIRIARESAQKKENEIIQKQEEYEQIEKEYAAFIVKDRISHEERIEAIRKKQEPFIDFLATNLPNINAFDKLDWYNDHLFIMIEGPKVKKLNDKEVQELNYAAASTALTTFDAVKTTATYDELLSLLDEGKLLFHSTRTRIGYLNERFPAQTKATELFELNFLPYYYGANRSYLLPPEELNNFIDAPMYYPPTYFETGSRNEKKEISKRFVDLTNKYPKEGLLAAKNVRIHLNPFVSYAQLLGTTENTPEKIIQLKNDNYWRAIYSRNNTANLKEAFGWLNCQKDMYAKLKNLSPEDWLAMGSGVQTLSRLEAKFIIKGLLDGNEAIYNDKLSNKYKNLKKAEDMWNKQIDKEYKEEKRLERKNK